MEILLELFVNPAFAFLCGLVGGVLVMAGLIWRMLRNVLKREIAYEQAIKELKRRLADEQWPDYISAGGSE